MFTLFCYLFALVPVIIGVVLWLMNKRVILFEVIGIAALCFTVAAVFNILAVKGMTDDIETWSGQVTKATYTPQWLEYYEYAVYRTEYYYVTVTSTSTNSKGRTVTTSRQERRSRQVFDHWEPTTRSHSPAWHANDTLIGTYSISVEVYEDIKKKFGGTVSPYKGDRTTGSHNSRMLSGDPNDYLTVNTLAYIYPVTTQKTWENRVRGSPSLFSFHKVDQTKVPVYTYPTNPDHFTSERLFGTACSVSIRKWDQLNAELGPKVFVNLIACGFNEGDMGLALEQEAFWLGGKKNDIVICFGGKASKPEWVYVFGWTEKDIVKKNLETLLLNEGFTNENLPKIKEIVVRDYVIKDWEKFAYLTVEVPVSRYIWLVVLVILSGGGMIAFAIMNDIDKNKFTRI